MKNLRNLYKFFMNCALRLKTWKLRDYVSFWASGFGEVKITIKVHRDEFLEKQYLTLYRLIKKYKWRWQAVGAVLACGGGLLSPVIGLILNLLTSYTRLSSEKPTLSGISTVFYIIAVPLLFVGAHFLDLLDSGKPDEENSIEQTIGHLGLPAKAEDF